MDRFVLAFVVCLAAAAHAARPFRIVSSASLPEGVTARDVRWAGPSEVYVSLGREGVIRASVTAPGRGTAVVMPPAARGGFSVSGLIAAGQKHLLVASQMARTVGWIPLTGSTRTAGERSFIALMDVDARGDAAAVLGADAGPQQGLARDGTIAWLGSFSKGLSDLKPLMKGRSRPGGKDMARCAILETGAIRFMQDGSIVVVPGVEPGVFRYAANGKLLQTWDTEPLGIVDDCDLRDDDLSLIARDFEQRIGWYASRVVIDDIVPLRSGPALLLRRVENGATRWDLVTLPYRGAQTRVTLPVSVASPRAHARADFRDGELVLLLFDDPLPRQKPVAPPRLVVLAMGVS